MKYISLILIIVAFLKSFYYGIFEIKEKHNKLGGITVCIFATIRAPNSICCNFYLLYLKSIQKNTSLMYSFRLLNLLTD